MYNLIFGDCLTQMNQIPDKSVDFIFTDLPYGTTKNSWDTLIPLNDFIIINGKDYLKSEFILNSIKFPEFHKMTVDELSKYFEEHKQHGLWSQYERIIKDNGCIALWAQSPFDKYLALSNPKLYRYEWIIKKTSPTGFLNANRAPMKAHENVLIFYKHLPLYNPQKTTGHPRKVSTAEHKRNNALCSSYNEYNLTSYDSTERFPLDVLEFKWDKQTSKLHPTQKPLAACEYFIKTYTDEGMTVLDSCIGSGTTGVACLNTNRNFIGIEADESIFDVAKNRMTEASRGVIV